MKIFKNMKDVLSNRRGSQVIEYVAVMAGAALLAIILMEVMESDKIQSALKEKIGCAIMQEACDDAPIDDENPDSRKWFALPKIELPPLPSPTNLFSDKSDYEINTADYQGTDQDQPNLTQLNVSGPRHKQTPEKDKRKSHQALEEFFKEERKRPHGTAGEVDLSDDQLMAAAQLAYDEKDVDVDEMFRRLGDGWEEDEDLFMDEKDGFQGRVLFNKDTGEVIISYRGTDPGLKDKADLKSNYQLTIGVDANQDQSAREFYQRALASYQGDEYQVVQVGHSLGGYLAQKMALENKIPTFTYNAPGVQSMTLNQHQANRSGIYDNIVKSYTMKNDVVGTYGTHVGEAYEFHKQGPVKVDDYKLTNRSNNLPDARLAMLLRDHFKSHGVEKLEPFAEEDGHFDLDR
ncbi:Mbeg1-like protein [Desmospora profundinema]|uniref:DUF2974 domain-containing protein n=1 Tax=Desmospora profundinema TaxID=1571184 RepID=A0ABU1ILG8_9BACL|nr:Mbeg1-like protein [Desmospora profundinema]MDR6225626.1 hypothetical protein [Desmospora profundinema]